MWADYVKDLRICGFLYLQGILEPILPVTEGRLYCFENETTSLKSISFQKHVISLNSLVTKRNFQEVPISFLMQLI